ncbi:hypothetical protein [Symmachiella macrocystis]|uniref:hypothetical protein n=1 Tax=Symmachiella macrocystis TaxID=2527985 RepID=UPI0011B6EDA0|nr:hypothetical protein [Symmachiella macrocystis]
MTNPQERCARELPLPSYVDLARFIPHVVNLLTSQAEIVSYTDEIASLGYHLALCAQLRRLQLHPLRLRHIVDRYNQMLPLIGRSKRPLRMIRLALIAIGFDITPHAIKSTMAKIPTSAVPELAPSETENQIVSFAEAPPQILPYIHRHFFGIVTAAASQILPQNHTRGNPLKTILPDPLHIFPKKTVSRQKALTRPPHLADAANVFCMNATDTQAGKTL